MSAVALVTFVDAELIGTLRLVVAGATTHNRLLWLAVSHVWPVQLVAHCRAMACMWVCNHFRLQQKYVTLR